jgi:hypothetical protein
MGVPIDVSGVLPQSAVVMNIKGEKGIGNVVAVDL